MESISKDFWVDIFVNPNIVSLKYGRAMELNAANAFFDLLSKQHKNFNLIDHGLFLDQDLLPYVGASPDRIISCDCCPQAVLEIKCPYSINHTSPADQKIFQFVPYLIKSDQDQLVFFKKS